MTARTPVPLRRRGASNAGDGRTFAPKPRRGPAPARCPRPAAPARRPVRPCPYLATPLVAPSPPGPVPGPSRSGLRWLRKERKNRKQNFLAAAGHQLHILQMPPSKNKPAAPPGRLTPDAPLGPLPQQLPDCGEGLIPHSRAPPGAPLPYTPLPGTERSFALKLDPKGPGGSALFRGAPL